MLTRAPNSIYMYNAQHALETPGTPLSLSDIRRFPARRGIENRPSAAPLVRHGKMMAESVNTMPPGDEPLLAEI
jgi:hypothetical protein